MKINLKSISGKNTEIEADSNITVSKLKEQLRETLNRPSDNVKLVFKRQILEDDKKIIEYDVKETDSIIFLFSRVSNKPISNKPDENKQIIEQSHPTTILQQPTSYNQTLPNIEEPVQVNNNLNGDLNIGFSTNNLRDELQVVGQPISIIFDTNGEILSREFGYIPSN